MGHVFVKARFRVRDEIEFERILVDTAASFTVMSFDVAEKHFLETLFTVDLSLVMVEF